MTMLPGKGVHLILNSEYLQFVDGCMEELGEVYTDELHDDDPEVVVQALAAREWTIEVDGFGTKAYKRIQYKKGELRFTVVRTKRGELKLDLREWYPAEA